MHQATQVSLESWLGGYENLYDGLRAEHPSISPLDLGTIGYSGEESVYVSGKVRQAAYGDSGLALDFYRSYNTSHRDPKQYLGGIGSFCQVNNIGNVMEKQAEIKGYQSVQGLNVFGSTSVRASMSPDVTNTYNL